MKSPEPRGQAPGVPRQLMLLLRMESWLSLEWMVTPPMVSPEMP